MWALEAVIPVSIVWGRAWRPEVRALCKAQHGEEGRTPGGKVTGKEAREKGSVMSLGVWYAKPWSSLHSHRRALSRVARPELHFSKMTDTRGVDALRKSQTGTWEGEEATMEVE